MSQIKCKKSAESDLTAQQELFCREYVINLNATQSAIRAGYSEKTAQEQSSRLLSNVMIQKYIDELKTTQFKRLEIEADDILNELMKIGYSDIRKIFDDDGRIKAPKDWPDDIAKSISSFDSTENFDKTGKLKSTTYKVKLWSKEKCLELMGKHKKLFTDTVSLNVNHDLAERIRKARERKVKRDTEKKDSE